MKFDYAYHISANGKIIFLGAILQIQMVGVTEIKVGTLEKIGPKGIYVRLPNMKNLQFYNFNNIAIIEEV